MSKTFQDGAEAMRTRVLDLIREWITNSNARQSSIALDVLNALAGDVMIAKVEPSGSLPNV